MFAALGELGHRRRRLLLLAAAAFVAVGVVWGTGVFGALTSGGMDDPASASSRAAAIVATGFDRDEADVVVRYSTTDGSAIDAVDGTGHGADIYRAVAALPPEIVVGATSFWSGGAPDLISADQRSALVLLRLSGADDDERQDQFVAVEPLLAVPGLTAQSGGPAAVHRDIGDRASSDLGQAEALSMPVLLVLLVLVLGGLAAAVLPLIIGGIAILGALTAIRLITLVTDVSVFAVNIVTLLGLGLAIDYSLCIVTRFREELRSEPTVQRALARTVATAGRTVAISGLTVALALSGLTVFPQSLLRSLGIGGICAVLVAMVASLTVLPALLAVLGHRVDALSVRPALRTLGGWVWPRAEGAHHRRPPGAWYRIARTVMRRPLVIVVVLGGALLLAGAPFLRISFGGVDERSLPADAPSRQVAESLAGDFGLTPTNTLDVVVSGQDGSPPDATETDRLVADIAALPNVDSAAVTGVAGATALVAVVTSGYPSSTESRDLVESLRAMPPPEGSAILVGGQSAALVDLLDSLSGTLPLMLLIVVGATLVLLFLAFGSVVLPVKAVLMNVLSLGATFGALVLIFQDGHLSGLLGFTPTGTIDATQPVLMFAIAFGLSMDYEVFLLARIREQYLRTGDNTEAVATGMQRTGGIITSAAVLLVVVVGAFSTSGITFVKLVGVGMIIAVLVDATVVRMLLVPATMKLMGPLNWWAPQPLRRFHARFHLSEGEDLASPADLNPAEPDQAARHRLPVRPPAGPPVGKGPPGRHRAGPSGRSRPATLSGAPVGAVTGVVAEAAAVG